MKQNALARLARLENKSNIAGKWPTELTLQFYRGNAHDGTLEITGTRVIRVGGAS